MRRLYAIEAMPRPRSLTQAAITAAALAVIDRDGVAGLSMRAVAAELGTGTMSLYRYAADREELERWVVDLVLTAVDPEAPGHLPWSGQVTVLAERVREAVAAHPAVVPLLLIHRHTSPHSWRWSETVLGLLTGAGFTGRRRVIAFRCLLAYIAGALQAESLGPLAGSGTAALAAPSSAGYPLLAQTVRSASAVPPGEEFGQGLAIVLRGFLTTLTEP
jgi:AcrR family transcriptional regulator